ncbi:glycosyl transferase [Pseudoalteromonas sp. S3178]|uniref:glycosyl transferase n=1 Tax=Pseudoalteromonas sp. S3178 TaxID=579532 RepID=UPI00110BCBE5|nr:glycosyl transferase [Pseudoalteromonas sp. S3178]TMP02601.1 glycosyl transferase [Pseudoalteromonas sp. S3178]
MAQNFSALEKGVARFLTAFPGVKRAIKKIYTRAIYFSKKKNYTYTSKAELVEISDGINESFYGYYDKFPDNGDGLVIVHLSQKSTVNLPKNVEKITLNIFSLKLKKLILDEGIDLLAFNWQQGARAHWLNKSLFAYNDYCAEKDIYVTKVFSIDEGRVIKTLDLPVQDSYKEEYCLSLCYKKLSVLRPDYGYFRHVIPTKKSDYIEGIWKVDYRSEKTTQIITLANILNFNFEQQVDDYDHKVNHIMISPDGKHFIFMHRYYSKSGRRFDRLILADSEGELINVLADNEMVSHCYWYDNSTILGYLRDPDGVDGYRLIDITTVDYESFNDGVFEGQGDGHPSVCEDFIVTDTYPDKSRMQTLYLTKKGSNKSIDLGEFFHGFQFSEETRCDLHPRMSSCSTYVFFDSVFSGERKLYCMDISEAKKEFI